MEHSVQEYQQCFKITAKKYDMSVGEIKNIIFKEFPEIKDRLKPIYFKNENTYRAANTVYWKYLLDKVSGLPETDINYKRAIFAQRRVKLDSNFEDMNDYDKIGEDDSKIYDIEGDLYTFLFYKHHGIWIDIMWRVFWANPIPNIPGESKEDRRIRYNESRRKLSNRLKLNEPVYIKSNQDFVKKAVQYGFDFTMKELNELIQANKQRDIMSSYCRVISKTFADMNKISLQRYNEESIKKYGKVEFKKRELAYEKELEGVYIKIRDLRYKTKDEHAFRALHDEVSLIKDKYGAGRRIRDIKDELTNPNRRIKDIKGKKDKKATMMGLALAELVPLDISLLITRLNKGRWTLNRLVSIVPEYINLISKPQTEAALRRVAVLSKPISYRFCGRVNVPRPLLFVNDKIYKKLMTDAMSIYRGTRDEFNKIMLKYGLKPTRGAYTKAGEYFIKAGMKGIILPKAIQTKARAPRTKRNIVYPKKLGKKVVDVLKHKTLKSMPHAKSFNVGDWGIDARGNHRMVVKIKGDLRWVTYPDKF